jgi:hypothetical protein
LRCVLWVVDKSTSAKNLSRVTQKQHSWWQEHGLVLAVDAENILKEVVAREYFSTPDCSVGSHAQTLWCVSLFTAMALTPSP